jgi:hypothetical protein
MRVATPYSKTTPELFVNFRSRVAMIQHLSLQKQRTPLIPLYVTVHRIPISEVLDVWNLLILSITVVDVHVEESPVRPLNLKR